MLKGKSEKETLIMFYVLNKTVKHCTSISCQIQVPQDFKKMNSKHTITYKHENVLITYKGGELKK